MNHKDVNPNLKVIDKYSVVTYVEVDGKLRPHEHITTIFESGRVERTDKILLETPINTRLQS